MAASFIEIKRNIGRKTPIFNTLIVFNLHDPLHPFEFLIKILKQTESLVYEAMQKYCRKVQVYVYCLGCNNVIFRQTTDGRLMP